VTETGSSATLSNTFNMGSATVARVAAGRICFANLPFTPNNITATMATDARFVSAGIQTQVSATCTGVPTAQAWVQVNNSLGATDNWDVYVVFN
jgi:hypothetical protein